MESSFVFCKRELTVLLPSTKLLKATVLTNIPIVSRNLLVLPLTGVPTQISSLPEYLDKRMLYEAK